MATKKGNKFVITNPKPVGTESKSTHWTTAEMKRPEHWEFRKCLTILATNHQDLDVARWALELMNTTFDEYGSKVAKFIPFILEFFMDRDRSPSDVACLWVISNWWYFYGLGPKPDMRRSPRRIISIHDDAWTNSLKCPVCDRLYDIPKGTTARNDIIQGYTKWLQAHAKVCQEPISKYQQRKNEKEKLERELLTNQALNDYSKREYLLKLQGAEAEKGLVEAVGIINRLELENLRLRNLSADRDYWKEQKDKLEQDLLSDPAKYRLTQADYWKLQKVRENITIWNQQIVNLSTKLNIRGTKTEITRLSADIKRFKKEEAKLLLKAGITK